MDLRTLITRAVIFVALFASAGRCVGAESLFSVIPHTARAALLVSDMQAARGHYVDAHDVVAPDGWTEAFGVDTEVFLKAVAGPAARAEIYVEKNTYAHLVVANVADEEAASRLFDDTQRRLTAADFRIRMIDQGGAKGIVADGQEGETARYRVVLSYRDHLLLVNNVQLAEFMLKMIAHRPPQCLENVAAWKAIRDRLTPPSPAEHVRLDWYVNPWAGVKPDKRAVRHGLDGIKAFGGAVQIDDGGSLAAEAMVYAPRPLSGSLRMLDLTPAESLVFPDWVSADVAERAAMLHGNVPAALENMGPVFDDLFAEGAEGTYEDVLEDLKDPEGLNVDLRRDLFPLLGPRVVMVHDRAVSESDKAAPPALVAFETNEPLKVARVMDLLMEGDREASRIEVAGAPVWKVASQDDGPESASTVTRGYAMYANDVKLLQRLLAAPAETALERRPDFARAKQAILARRSADWCVVVGRSLSNVEATRGAKWKSPVDAVFSASWSGAFADVQKAPAASWWTFDRLPFLESTGVALGYLQDDGWLFVSEK